MPLKAATPSLVLYDHSRMVPLPHGHARDYRDKHELTWAQFDAAWEEGGVVYLRTAIGHPSNAGLVLSYPEPHASKIKAALGDQVKSQPPAKE